MKLISLILSLFFMNYSFSQVKNKMQGDSLHKKKLLPCNNIDCNDLKIDTIELTDFVVKVNSLSNEMSKSKYLNLDDDKTLISMMNTLMWQDFDKQKWIEEEVPGLLKIETLFNKKYQKILEHKYNVCIGRGFASYYVELKIQYLGNPFACDRYYIKK